MSDRTAKPAAVAGRQEPKEPTPEVLKAENLVKCFDTLTAVDELSFSVHRGEIFGFLGPNGAGKRPFRAYSKGMKRKLTIAAGNIHEPKILFLDEPTTGIDVMSARQIRGLLPGVVSMSILFGTTSMLAVTISFERRSRSFQRLLLAPINLSLLMPAKTGGAILFGVLIACTSAFLGLFISVAVQEVFEAQTFSNFFRFPMLFLFRPVQHPAQVGPVICC